MTQSARQIALHMLRTVKAGGIPPHSLTVTLSPQEAAFAKALVESSLRHSAFLQAVLRLLIAPKKTLKPAALHDIILLGLAQILLLSTQTHAAVSETVNLTRLDGHAHAAGFVNALLRRAAREHDMLLNTAFDLMAHMPKWLKNGLVQSLTETQQKTFLQHAAHEPNIDIYAVKKPDIEGIVDIAPYSYRVLTKDRIDTLPDYQIGTWWVQDLASTLPVRMLGNVHNKSILDVCAAPGGKTMQATAMGAQVTAIDIDAGRLQRMQANLTRTHTHAHLICADILTYVPDQLFDAVIVDAPCSAVGTLRRHPELPFVHVEDKLPELLITQAKMLNHCAQMIVPGGRLVYATCSVLKAEGEDQLAQFLKTHQDFHVVHTLLPDVFERNRLPSGAVLMGVDPSLETNGFYAAVVQKE